MFVKIMSGQDMPDGDQRKSYDVYEARRVSFYRSAFPTPESLAYAEIRLADGDCITAEVCGNAYVMNDQGRTVASFSPNAVGERLEVGDSGGEDTVRDVLDLSGPAPSISKGPGTRYPGYEDNEGPTDIERAAAGG